MSEQKIDGSPSQGYIDPYPDSIDIPQAQTRSRQSAARQAWERQLRWERRVGWTLTISALVIGIPALIVWIMQAVRP